jgi:citronellol/citronellal dehydrogenase
MMDIEGRTVLVTGASQGIGSVLAQHLSREGARVVIAARSQAGLDSVAETIKSAGGQVLAIPVDVSDRKAVEAMIGETIAHFGRLDAIVNNAALMGNNTSLLQPLEAFESEMNVNLHGTLYTIHAAQPHLERSSGKILNVSSLLALNVMAGMFAYGVSKIAIERLTLDVAAQLADAGVACNALRIDLPVFGQDRGGSRNTMDEKAQQQIAVMGAYAEPLETGAAAMAWMLSQPPSYTGQLDSLRDMIERGAIAGTAKEIMPLAFASRWNW